MYQLKIEAQVYAEFENSFLYYKNITTRLADRFREAFLEKLDDIEENPLLFQVRYKNIRMAHFKTFPYSIHYFVEEDIVYVLRVLNQRQFVKGLK